MSTASRSEFPDVLVLGCGWLGLSLARSLVQAGHRVVGTTTTPEHLDNMRAFGIESHLLRLGSDFGPAADAQLDLSALPAGVYVLRLRDAQGQTALRRLVRE